MGKTKYKRKFLEYSGKIVSPVTKSISAGVGATIAARKAALETVTVAPLAVGRTLRHAPVAAYDIIRKKMARGKITKRIGFNQTQILSKLDKFKKQNDVLQEKIKKFEQKIIQSSRKINPTKVQKTQNKISALQAQINKQRQKYINKELQKTRKFKEKGISGKQTTFKLSNLAQTQTGKKLTANNFKDIIRQKYEKQKAKYDNKILGKKRTINTAAKTLVDQKQQEVTDLKKTIANAGDRRSLVDVAKLRIAEHDLVKLQAKQTITEAKLEKLKNSKSIRGKEFHLAQRKAISNASLSRLKSAVSDIGAPIRTLKEGAQSAMGITKAAGKYLQGNTDIKSASETFKESIGMLKKSIVGTNSFKRTANNLTYIGKQAFITPVQTVQTGLLKLADNTAKKWTERTTFFRSKTGLQQVKTTVENRLDQTNKQLTEINRKLITNLLPEEKAKLLEEQYKLNQQLQDATMLKAKVDQKLYKYRNKIQKENKLKEQQQTHYPTGYPQGYPQTPLGNQPPPYYHQQYYPPPSYYPQPLPVPNYPLPLPNYPHPQPLPVPNYPQPLPDYPQPLPVPESKSAHVQLIAGNSNI